MIDDKELQELKRKARQVVSGRLLADDAVTDRVEHLLDQVSAFPWPVSEWQDAVRAKPAVARSWLESLTELRYLVGQVDEHHGLTARIEEAYSSSSNIRDITEEVEGA